MHVPTLHTFFAMYVCSPSRSRRSSTTPGGAKGPNGRRCHGAAAAAAALFGGQAHDPYMVPPLGWKQECGSAGLAAAEAATDAALALVQQLGQQGRPAVVKVRAAAVCIACTAKGVFECVGNS
jgi:hypothetical protein